MEGCQVLLREIQMSTFYSVILKLITLGGIPGLRHTNFVFHRIIGLLT